MLKVFALSKGVFISQKCKEKRFIFTLTERNVRGHVISLIQIQNQHCALNEERQRVLVNIVGQIFFWYLWPLLFALSKFSKYSFHLVKNCNGNAVYEEIEKVRKGKNVMTSIKCPGIM